MNKNRILQLRQSEDGSNTLFVPAMDEHYHSTFGAFSESMHVFIRPNLLFASPDSLSILEIGFGTGLNAFLSATNCNNRAIYYHSLEKYPIDPSLAEQLNYGSTPEEKALFQKMHLLPWQSCQLLQEGFTLLKDQCDLTEVELKHTYDLVYFDAFAPDKQPEMWTEEIFRKIYGAMNPDGILTTYCAKGVVRRTLQSCGFTVERLPGPKGKREMLRAIKKAAIPVE